MLDDMDAAGIILVRLLPLILSGGVVVALSLG